MPTASKPFVIDYVDTLPGVGKTHWMFEKIEQFVIDSIASAVPIRSRSPRVVLYVAPTHKVLEQQARVLIDRLHSRGVHPDKVLTLLHHWDEPFLRRISVARAFAKAIPTDEGGALTVPRGTVIFMTHEAFASLPYSADPRSIAWQRTQLCSVYFDEARQVLSAVAPRTRLPATLLYALCDLAPAYDEDGRESAGYKRFVLANGLTPDGYKAAMDKHKAVLTEGMRAAARDLYALLSNPRYEVYARVSRPMQQDHDDLANGVRIPVSDTRHHHLHSFYKLTLPVYLFTGYAKVTLASAWLRSSQLFHMLRQQARAGHVILNDVTKELHARVEAGQEFSRYVLIRRRLTQVRILPVLQDDDRPLSKSKLTQVLAFPSAMRAVRACTSADTLEADLDDIREYVTRSSPTQLMLRNSVEHDRQQRQAAKVKNARVRPIDKMMELERLGEFYKHPVRYMAARAVQAFRQQRRAEWDATGALLVVNNSHIEQVRAGSAKLDPESPITFADLESRGMVRFMSSYSHGLNCYMGYKLIAFLSAILPNPDMINLFRLRFGNDYDYEKDFLISTCAQSVARTAMRDVDSASQVLVVVPDRFTAMQLQKHFDELPSVMAHLGIDNMDKCEAEGRRIEDLQFYDIDSFLTVGNRTLRFGQAGRAHATDDTREAAFTEARRRERAITLALLGSEGYTQLRVTLPARLRALQKLIDAGDTRAAIEYDAVQQDLTRRKRELAALKASDEGRARAQELAARGTTFSTRKLSRKQYFKERFSRYDSLRVRILQLKKAQAANTLSPRQAQSLRNHEQEFNAMRAEYEAAVACPRPQL